MKISRRNVLKIAGFGTLAITLLPRIAFASRNSLNSIRTGIQPGNKTRLVIETSKHPSYSLSYLQNKLVVSLANTSANSYITPSLVSTGLVKSITQTQSGDRLLINASLSKPVSAIPKNQIMILPPSGDNNYRLVLDFVSGTTGAFVAAKGNNTVVANTKKRIIVIDAGHGGKDPGCIGRGGTKEKDIVLSISKKLKTKLDSSGFKTHLTRSTDIFLKLDDRAAIAEKHHADLFISLHVNANPSRTMKGFSTYTLSKKASDEEARKLAEAENAVDKIYVKDFKDFEPDIKNALSALQQQAFAEMSVEYASGVAKVFKSSRIEQQPGPDVRHAPFAVLRASTPGALLELGHLSNSAEETMLKTAAHQNKLVDAIAKSISNYNFED